MFDTLAEKLSGVFDRLARRGALTESDVDTAMREIRIALLEADVALPVVFHGVDATATLASYLDWCDALRAGERDAPGPEVVFFRRAASQADFSIEPAHRK